jgi:flavorubredoxin
MKGMKFKNKKAAAFGAYGWSGESPAIVEEELKKCGYEIIGEKVKALWNPDEEAIKVCFELGEKIGELCKG